jgi:hypothetical protein
MNYDAIAKALAAGPGFEEFHALVHACNVRRQEIRARIESITDATPPAPRPTLRQQAMDQGLAAVEKLDREIESLWREYGLLDQLETRINEAREARITERVRREMPAAKKQLPRRLAAVRDALAALDTALSDLGGTVATLAEYERTPDRSIPLSDDELAEMLTVRDQVWQQRNMAVLTPRRETHPKSWELAHVVKPDGTWYAKRPGPWLPDFATDGR